MIKTPYIFFTSNFLKNCVNEDLEDASAIREINVPAADLPYSKTVFFTDPYGKILKRDFDALILRNTNIKNLIIEVADDDGNYSAVFNLQNNEDETIVVKLAQPVSTSSVRLIIPEDEALPLDENIQGSVALARYICDLYALTESNFKTECNAGHYRTVSGRMVFYSDFSKVRLKIKTENLPKEQFDALTSEIRARKELIILPFKDFDATAIYECYVVPEYSYEVNRRTGLYALDLEALEL